MSDICCPLNEAAHISVNQAGVSGPGGALLYSELEQCVCATVKLIERKGWNPGERIILAVPFDWKDLVLILAMMRFGAVVCPVDPACTDEQLKRAIQFLGSTRVFVPESREPDFSCEGVSVEQIDPYVGFIDKMKIMHKPHIPLERPASVLLCLDDESFSGYVYPYGAHYYGALGGNRVIRITSEDRWLSAVPVFMPGGLDAVFRCIISGAVIVLPAPDESIIDAIKKYEVSHLTLTAEQLDTLLTEEPSVAVLRDLERIVVMNRATPVDLLKRAQQQKLNVCSGYMTSAVPGLVTCSEPKTPLASKYTSGMPHRYCQLRVSDAGQIEVAGHVLADGSIRDGETIPLDLEAGWLPTDDKGSFDQQGCLIVT